MRQPFQGTFLAWHSFSGCSRQHAAAGCRTRNPSAMHYLLLRRLKSETTPSMAAVSDDAKLATEAMPDMPPVSGTANVSPTGSSDRHIRNALQFCRCPERRYHARNPDRRIGPKKQITAPRISGNGHLPTFPKEMERPSSRQNRVPPALHCSAFLPSSARGSHKNQRAPPGRLSHTSGQVWPCRGTVISEQQ